MRSARDLRSAHELAHEAGASNLDADAKSLSPLSVCVSSVNRRTTGTCHAWSCSNLLDALPISELDCARTLLHRSSTAVARSEDAYWGHTTESFPPHFCSVAASIIVGRISSEARSYCGVFRPDTCKHPAKSPSRKNMMLSRYTSEKAPRIKPI